MTFKSSYSDALLPKDEVRVRYFRGTDPDKVRELFLFTMSYGPRSPRRLALDAMFFKPSAHVAYIMILTGLSVIVLSERPLRRAFGLMLSVTAACLLLGYRALLSKSFTDFYETCLTDDLADIASHYHMQPAQDGTNNFMPSGPSAFWVVECDLPDRSSTEIIGCVALDCRYEDGVLRGELRRMNVSPYHRRRGIARLLVQTLLAHAHKHRVPAVMLTTTHFQEAAISMYETLGWVETSRDVIYDHRIIKVVLIHFRLESSPSSATGIRLRFL